MRGDDVKPTPGETPEQPPPLRPGKPSRTTLLRIGSRACFVLGVLLVVAVGRIDQAVRTAYATGWVAPADADDLTVAGSCDGCNRLPSGLWIVVYVSCSLAIALAFLAAITLTRRHKEDTGSLDPFLRWITVGVGVLSLGAAIVRWRAAEGDSPGLVTFAFVLTALMLLALAAIAFAVAEATAPRDPSRARRVRLFLQRQGVNVVAVVFLALTVTLISQTSGQAIDSIRTWGVGSSEAFERLALGFAATLLLALVLYESAARLEQAPIFRDPDSHPLKLRARWSFAAGGSLVTVGFFLALLGPFGLDLAGVGIVLVVIGVLELLNPPPRTGDTPTRPSEDERPPESYAAEYFAIVPLLAIASVAVAAAVESALSDGPLTDLRDALIAAAALAGAAVIMVAPRPARLDAPHLRGWVVAVVVAFLTVGVAVAFDDGTDAAIVSFLPGVVLILYTFWVFRLPHWTTRPRRIYAPPVALAVGVAVFVATHVDVHALAPSIGVFTLVNLGLALTLAGFHFLVHLGLRCRPPRALGALGIQHFPVVTAVVAAWLIAGSLPFTPTSHDTRLVDRQPVTADDGPLPQRQTLSEAFATWQAAQPELSEGAPATEDPLPLVLVASHGGGIRAAYWTALALDCVIGARVGGVEPGSVGDDDATRSETCTTRRPLEDQQVVARRIFLASGVSGGAMGLYGYARELLSAGYLEDGWVEQRLKHDYASATIAWSLFHDMPNHFLGLHSDAGRCEWEMRGRCLSLDRAAVLEDAFDRSWPGEEPPHLRRTWDLRLVEDQSSRAELVPLLITNATVTGGRARAFVSAADLGTWPLLETADSERETGIVKPLAGVVDAVDALCNSKDMLLSTAAYLGGRFPFVGPSGHFNGDCLQSGELLEKSQRQDDADNGAPCLKQDCETRLVDGGYADNSGLLTIDLLWPELKELVVEYNEQPDAKRQIAPIILELDNHYQARLESPLPAGGVEAESLVPLSTAFGARTSIETMARSLAYGYLPPSCTVTVSPSLHPGLVAPLGWELSPAARADLERGLVLRHPLAEDTPRFDPAYKLRRLQQWFGSGIEQSSGFLPELSACVPKSSEG